LVLAAGIGKQIVLARLHLYSPMTAVKVRDAFVQALLLYLEVEGKNLAVGLERKETVTDKDVPLRRIILRRGSLSRRSNLSDQGNRHQRRNRQYNNPAHRFLNTSVHAYLLRIQPE